MNEDKRGNKFSICTYFIFASNLLWGGRTSINRCNSCTLDVKRKWKKNARKLIQGPEFPLPFSPFDLSLRVIGYWTLTQTQTFLWLMLFILFTYCSHFLHFSPNTSSSSSSPTERNFWPQEADSEDQERQSYARKMKRSRSCLSKSKRRRSPGTPKAGTQDVEEFMTLKGFSSGHKEEHCCNSSPQGHSWDRTEEMAPCSCSDSDHDLAACRRTCDECPYTAGSPVSIPGRKAKRRRWNSNSESSCESKHLFPRDSSSDEMSDLEPQFIPKLTNDSIELTEDEQFTNVILQFSESCLEEGVSILLNESSVLPYVRLPIVLGFRFHPPLNESDVGRGTQNLWKSSQHVPRL